MTVRDKIIRKIKEHVFISATVDDLSNMYTDLGFDSLSFIALLTELEEVYSVVFGITEMEECLQVGRLITAVENKLKERDNCNA